MNAARFLLACGCLFGCLNAEAAPAAPDCVGPELVHARLLGEGSFRWLGLKIYDARLWVGSAGMAPDAPFALELRYARTLSGHRIAAASAEEIARLGLGSAAQRSEWTARMQRLFPDVQEGTRLTGIYLPGKGVCFYRNRVLLGQIDDPAFAHAFFAIWLDPRTSAPGLRQKLLGGATE